MDMVKEFLRIISKTVYAIKSIFIFTFSLLSFLGGAQGECKIIEFKKNATEINCSLRKTFQNAREARLSRHTRVLPVL